MKRWSEEAGRRAVSQRSGAIDSRGRCEGCGSAAPLDFAHRIRRSQGGPWSPSNALALCRRCHEFAHDRPLLAQALGWEVLPHVDLSRRPVWMIHREMGPAWYLLIDREDGHIAELFCVDWIIPEEPE
jgi:HNH endonuclease